jgi:hypothetical protein
MEPLRAGVAADDQLSVYVRTLAGTVERFLFLSAFPAVFVIPVYPLICFTLIFTGSSLVRVEKKLKYPSHMSSRLFWNTHYTEKKLPR